MYMYGKLMRIWGEKADLSNQSRGKRGQMEVGEGRGKNKNVELKTLVSLVPSDVILIDRGMVSSDNRVLCQNPFPGSLAIGPRLSMTMALFFYCISPGLPYLTSILPVGSTYLFSIFFFILISLFCWPSHPCLQGDSSAWPSPIPLGIFLKDYISFGGKNKKRGSVTKFRVFHEFYVFRLP